MDAIHINWTKPYTLRTDMPYSVEDFELLTTILSALKWQEKNGDIKMITDSVGKKFYEEIGIDKIWNKGIDTSLDHIPEHINPGVFWAAGKLFALKIQSAPIAMVDTDFIVWDEILFDNLHAVTAIHFEDLYSDVYPDKSYFQMKNGYSFDDSWNWSLKACNTAFCVFKNQELIDYYTSEAIRFMENAADTNDPLKYMVFAEQRLLPMCADKMNLYYSAFSDLNRLFTHAENYFTHTWGMKQQMRDIPELRFDFCKRCFDRIIRDYPHMKDILSNIECIKQYL
ncbi:MAG: DUF6734 family protein [Clostridia bacterium]